MGSDYSRLYFSYRFIVAILGCLGIAAIYTMEACLTVAIVAMTKPIPIPNHNNTTDIQCHFNTTDVYVTKHQGKFSWNQKTQSLVLSAFFYGYTFSQILGGLLSDRYGGKIMATFGSLTCAILTLFMPLCADISVYLFTATRFLQGILQGIFYPAVLTVTSRWCTTAEKTIFMAIVSSGSNLGIFVSQSLSGYLSNLQMLNSWQLPFYVFGGFTIIWAIFWIIFTSNNPSENRFISSSERELLMRCSETKIPESQSSSIPWIKVVTSLPLIGLCIGSFGLELNAQIVFNLFPTYLYNVLGVQLNTNGIMSSIPFILFWVGVVVGGLITDIIRNRWLSTIATRRLMFFTGCLMTAAFNIMIRIADCNYVVVVVFVSLSLFCTGVCLTQTIANCVEVFPKFVGLTSGIMNSFANSTGVFSPNIGYLITNKNIHSKNRWQTVFDFTSGFFFISGGICVLLMQANPVKWASNYEELSNNKSGEDGNSDSTEEENIKAFIN